LQNFNLLLMLLAKLLLIFYLCFLLILFILVIALSPQIYSKLKEYENFCNKKKIELQKSRKTKDLITTILLLIFKTSDLFQGLKLGFRLGKKLVSNYSGLSL